MKLKSIFTILLLASLGMQSFARKTLPFQFYKIISDTLDSTVPDGKCLIVGTIFYNGEGVNEATIETENHKVVNSNKIGKFKILIDISNTYLIISKRDFANAYVEHYKFKSKHKISIDIFMPLIADEEFMLVDKPVIYAYNQTPLDFSLTFKTDCENLFTYPKYDEQWSMKITKEGMLKDKNNKEYPYLFWEGKLENLQFKTNDNTIKGSTIAKEGVVDFLESNLSKMGLNAKEQTDFITFWAPRMIQHEEVFVQFLIDKDYETISTMEINPKPDNMKRIYLLYTSTDNLPIDFKSSKQEFSSFDRNGFTIVEWGGSEIKTLPLSSN